MHWKSRDIAAEEQNGESMYTLTSAYHDITLNGKAIRDGESSEVLDIIFDTATFDLGSFFGWGTLHKSLNNASTFMSQLAAYESTALSEIEATMDVVLG